MNKPLVSICCLAYNHEKYIADALEGFIKQTTNFDIEILIHDDASTDRTVEIIKEYENKYPNIVKPIYQTENQHSKGVRISHKYNFLRAKGEYIAVCEGDDYWIDSYKLQKQVDYMQSHSECTFCFTNGKIIDVTGKQNERIFVPYTKMNADYFENNNGIYNAGELALLGFIPTASFLFRKSSINEFPEFYYESFPAGDIKLSLLLASQGYAYCINDITCVYRVNVAGSLMTQWKKYDRNQIVKHNQRYIDLFELIDEYNNYKYTKEFFKAKMPFELRKLISIGDKTILKDKQYREYLKQQSINNRIKIYLSLYFPKIYEVLKHIIKR